MVRVAGAERKRAALATQRLAARADRPRSVVIASYARPRACPNLTPLLALLLERYGVPVVVHGPTGDGDGRGGSATWEVLRELGILPAGSIAAANSRLASGRLVYVDASLIGAAAPDDGSSVAATRRMAALVDPFGGAGVRIVGATGGGSLASLRAYLVATAADALLLRATGGEPFADPRQPPRIECYLRGAIAVLFEARASEQPPARLPPPGDAAAIAAWTAGVLAGRVPIPRAILNELACCMHAVRRDGTPE